MSVVGGELLEFAQVYRLAEFPADGAEVFSLMRDSDLDADQYLSTFFDTGSEREGTIESELVRAPRTDAPDPTRQYALLATSPTARASRTSPLLTSRTAVLATDAASSNYRVVLGDSRYLGRLIRMAVRPDGGLQIGVPRTAAVVGCWDSL